MNERITLLALKASDPKTGWLDRQKFAELIVKECSYLADQAHYKATGGKSAGGYIRQHFGVE